ncbi:MAG: TlpA family protein disulfide reductase [Flavobacteriales bacterium]|jgi:peroxiredoxin|nr:TlpA family protein disulfide reductase [Flavobacteriales bacterium]
MRTIITFLTMLIGLTSIVAQNKKLPAVKLKTIDGKTVNLATISNDGNPIVVNFWATWCKPCKTELNTIAEEYEDWQDETGVKIIAVSIDNSRSTGRVEPYVNGQGWEYEVLLDPNGELKRAMNVNNVPHTFLIDGKGNIVWDHNNYSAGDEEELYEQIKKHAH